MYPLLFPPLGNSLALHVASHLDCRAVPVWILTKFNVCGLWKYHMFIWQTAILYLSCSECYKIGGFLFLVQVCHICRWTIFFIILSYLRLPLLSTHFCRQHCDNGPKTEGFYFGFIFKPVTPKHFHLSAPKRPAGLITPLKNSFSKGSNSMGTGSMPHNFWGDQVSLPTRKIMLESLIHSLVKTSRER